MIKKQKFSAVILAAGLSERMGKAKMFLLWKGKSFIEHIIEGYINCGISEVIVVVNKNNITVFNNIFKDNLSVRAILNEHPDKGRFYSLQKGLNALKHINSCFIHNVDNPVVEKAVIESMENLINNTNYVVPIYNDKKGHPILLSKFIVNKLINEQKEDINIKTYLNQFDKNPCEVSSDKIHININNIEDFERFSNHI